MTTRADKERAAKQKQFYEEWKKQRDTETTTLLTSTEENSSVDVKKGTIRIGDTTYEVDEKDCFIWLKNNADWEKPHEILCSMPQVKDGVLTIPKPFLIAWGLHYLMSDGAWLDKLIERTKLRLEEQLKPITKKE